MNILEMSIFINGKPKLIIGLRMWAEIRTPKQLFLAFALITKILQRFFKHTEC